MAANPAVLKSSQTGSSRSANITARRRALLTDLVGISPTMALYGAFIIIPTAFALFLSFTNWDVDGPIKWAGFANWSEFFSDPVSYHSLLVTFELAAFSWLAQTPVAMALGIFIAGTQRYRAVYAALYLLPLLLSTAGLSLMWQDVLFPQFGGLAWLGIHAHLRFLSRNWLGSSHLALYTIVVIIAWQFVPFHTLIFQAGRRAIPAELYDAASVDGASMRQSFWHVTLPQLRYSIVTSSTLVLVGSLTYFDIIYILTSGGPGNTTRVLAMDMYNIGFNQTEFGYASAIATVLGLIGILLAVLLVRLSGFGSMQGTQEGIW
ncbi:MAG TPA: sugar ABC transporter permease [Acidimicrobiales bacterium]|nr:sugar ABC transporter permease [Acidimicrobiales bacterium]